MRNPLHLLLVSALLPSAYTTSSQGATSPSFSKPGHVVSHEKVINSTLPTTNFAAESVVETHKDGRSSDEGLQEAEDADETTPAGGKLYVLKRNGSKEPIFYDKVRLTWTSHALHLSPKPVTSFCTLQTIPVSTLISLPPPLPPSSDPNPNKIPRNEPLPPRGHRRHNSTRRNWPLPRNKNLRTRQPRSRNRRLHVNPTPRLLPPRRPNLRQQPPQRDQPQLLQNPYDPRDPRRPSNVSTLRNNLPRTNENCLQILFPNRLQNRFHQRLSSRLLWFQDSREIVPFEGN